MAYVENNLMAGESIVYKARLHWFIYVPGGVFFVIGLLLFVSGEDSAVGPVLGTISVFVAIVLAVKAWVFKNSTELAITSNRVIAKMGLIKRHTVELNHGKVESFNVDQSIFGRIFDFGTLIVNGTGGGKTPIAGIESPLEFRRNAMQAIDASQAT